MRELVDPLLADFCEEWFGLSTDGRFLLAAPAIAGIGSGPAAELPRSFPRTFALFLPTSSQRPEVEKIGKAHGVALRSAMIDFLRAHDPQITAPVARAILDSTGPGSRFRRTHARRRRDRLRSDRQR